MENKTFAIQWENNYSHETGYVKSVRKTKGYFENTFDATEAKKYRSEKAAQGDLAWLWENNKDNSYTVR